jgi:hypothetical protein
MSPRHTPASPGVSTIDWALERDRFWQVAPKEMLNRLEPLSDRAVVEKGERA